MDTEARSRIIAELYARAFGDELRELSNKLLRRYVDRTAGDHRRRNSRGLAKSKMGGSSAPSDMKSTSARVMSSEIEARLNAAQRKGDEKRRRKLH